MKTRSLWVTALFLVAGTAGLAPAADAIPLGEVTAPWLALLRSGDPEVRAAASSALVGIVRKHPAAANDLVRRMAAEENGGVAADYERRLVPLAKESPATVSALIRMVREPEANYRLRNFGVKVLSQVGPAAATSEFVEALAETHCPVLGAFLRVMRALGKDATPVLIAGFRHANPTIRTKATNALRVIGRTDPAMQKLFEALQAEPPLVHKIRTGTPEERIAAVATMAELARTTLGTATVLAHALKDADMNVLREAVKHLGPLGRDSHELVAVLVAGVRSKDDYRLRRISLAVLPKVGPGLNCKETVEALGDRYCPVPNIMRRILINAGSDAMPVLSKALAHPNGDIRAAAERFFTELPRPAVVGATVLP